MCEGDDTYAIVHQTVRIKAVEQCDDHPDIVKVIVRNIETGTEFRLFTDQKSHIKTCFNGLGKTVEVEYEGYSGELLGAKVRD